MRGVAPYLIAFVCLVAAACSAKHRTEYDAAGELRSRARHAAVLPLANLTTYPSAGKIVGEILATELYARGGLTIMERSSMLEKLREALDNPEDIPDSASALRLGRLLDVDTVVFGSVTEFRYRKGLEDEPAVGLTVRVLDVPTNRIVWAASSSRSSPGVFRRETLSGLAQRMCSELAEDMLPERR